MYTDAFDAFAVAQANVNLGHTLTTWVRTRTSTHTLTHALNRDKQVVAFLHESHSWAGVESFLVWANPPADTSETFLKCLVCFWTGDKIGNLNITFFSGCTEKLKQLSGCLQFMSCRVLHHTLTVFFLVQLYFFVIEQAYLVTVVGLAFSCCVLFQRFRNCSIGVNLVKS